jgi:hypothetical protein
MKPLCTLIVIAAALAAAAPASAEVTVEGSGEPAFTSSTNNTQWVRSHVPAGTDAYRLHISWYRDAVLVTDTRISAPTSGVYWIDWAGVATLEEGKTYAICVQGEYSFPNDSLYFPDGPSSCQSGANQGKRTSTTIDRTKPTTSIVAAGGAQFTKGQSIPLSIGFQDATAGPFPATWLCVQPGANPCDSGFTHKPECSVPAGGGKNTTFTCGVDASQLPDGPVTICAIGADAALPNNASSANQTGQASQANRSDAQCDTVVLDRQGPTLTVGASKTVALTGEQVAFSATASDSGSGVDATAFRWEFDAGTPVAAGASASHSFGQPGTYVVTFRAKDQVGNESVAQKTITVNEPPSDGPSIPNDPGTPSDPGTPNGPATPSEPAPGGPVTGDGRLASVQIGGVTVFVPKRVRLGSIKKLVLGARAEQAGKLTLRLARGKKVYSRLTVSLAPGDSSQKLRLPKGLKPGTYAVKIAFKATGAGWSAAGSAKVAFQRGK